MFIVDIKKIKMVKISFFLEYDFSVDKLILFLIKLLINFLKWDFFFLFSGSMIR